MEQSVSANDPQEQEGNDAIARQAETLTSGRRAVNESTQLEWVILSGGHPEESERRGLDPKLWKVVKNTNLVKWGTPARRLAGLRLPS